MGGNFLNSSQDISKIHTIVTDYTTQLNNTVLWKSGITARFHQLDNKSRSINVSGDEAFVVLGTPLKEPWEFSTYSQVKLEFDNLIVNAGLRFDYFDADFFVPKDPQSFIKWIYEIELS